MFLGVLSPIYFPIRRGVPMRVGCGPRAMPRLGGGGAWARHLFARVGPCLIILLPSFLRFFRQWCVGWDGVWDIGHFGPCEFFLCLQ